MTSAADLDKIIARLADIANKTSRTAADLSEYQRLHRQATAELSSAYPTKTAARAAVSAAVAAAQFSPPVTVERQGTLDI